MNYVIIGNSYAGISAAEAIREIDSKGEITIISYEPYSVYSRPLISYHLAGKVSEENMYYRPLDFYEKMNINTLLGKEVKMKILKSVAAGDEYCEVIFKT